MVSNVPLRFRIGRILCTCTCTCICTFVLVLTVILYFVSALAKPIPHIFFTTTTVYGHLTDLWSLEVKFFSRYTSHTYMHTPFLCDCPPIVHNSTNMAEHYVCTTSIIIIIELP